VRVLAENIPPAARRTAVELSDRDVQLIDRALTRDDANNDDNSDLWDEFYELLKTLRLTRL
jgi:hypothetical protein